MHGVSAISGHLGRLPFVLVLALLVLFLIACEPDKPDTAIDITMDENMPPTFSFSGPWWAVDFEVSEVPPNVPINTLVKVKTIWKTSVPTLLRAKNWPEVTYGVVPEGFTQKIPAHGKPPNLVEGKIYVAQALDTSRSGGACYFIIRNGKPVNPPMSELFRA